MPVQPPAQDLALKVRSSLGHDLAVLQVMGASSSPTVVWLGGFRSDMMGTKSTLLADHAKRVGWNLLRFDYFAHGQSDGTWDAGRIGTWRQDTLDVIGQRTVGPLILVGSSMGGWMALHAALQFQDRVKGLVLIAPAPDFPTTMLEKEMSPEALRGLSLNGVWMMPSDPYPPVPMYQAFFDESRAWNLLDRPIGITCPVHILHGAKDTVVPYGHGLQLVDKLTSEDVTFELIKGADHGLSRQSDMRRLFEVVAGMGA